MSDTENPERFAMSDSNIQRFSLFSLLFPFYARLFDRFLSSSRSPRMLQLGPVGIGSNEACQTQGRSINSPHDISFFSFPLPLSFSFRCLAILQTWYRWIGEREERRRDLRRNSSSHEAKLPPCLDFRTIDCSPSRNPALWLDRFYIRIPMSEPKPDHPHRENDRHIWTRLTAISERFRRIMRKEEDIFKDRTRDRWPFTNRPRAPWTIPFLFLS